MDTTKPFPHVASYPHHHASRRHLFYSTRNTRLPLITAQKRPIAPGGGTVKFKAPTPERPTRGTGFGGSLLGSKKRDGTVQLTGTASLRGRLRQRDPKTVFVTGGATPLGSRIVRELLSLGFKIRAGCASIEEAEQDLDVLVRYGVIAVDQSRNVSFVEVDWTDEDIVLGAVGNAGKVIFTGEGGPGNACVSLIGLCEELGIGQFILVLSTSSKSASTNAYIGGGGSANMKQAQIALEKSGLSFTVVQPGSMERAPDTLKETHNVTLGKKGGQISKLQVAEFVASCAINPEATENKQYDIAADPAADYLPYEELMSQGLVIISKADQLERLAEKQAITDEIAALVERVTSLEAGEEDAKERIIILKDRIKELQAVQKSKKTDAAAMLKSTSQVEKRLTSLTAAVEQQENEEAVLRALYASAQKASRDGRILTREEEQDIEFAVLNPEVVRQREEEEARRQQEEAEAAAEAAKAEAEAKAAAEKEAKARAAAEAKAKAEAAAKQREEAKAKAKAAAEEAAAKKKAQEEARAKAMADAAAKKKAQEEAKAKAQAEAAAKKKAEEEAKAKAQAEAAAKKKAEEEARARAEAAAKKKAEEEARARAEAAAKRKAEEEARARAEAAAKRKAEEEARARAEAAAKRKAEEEARAKAEATARRQKLATAQTTNQEPMVNPFSNIFSAFKAPWDTAPQKRSAVMQDQDRPTAREWIDVWQKEQTGARLSAKEWIANWRNDQSSGKAK